MFGYLNKSKKITWNTFEKLIEEKKISTFEYFFAKSLLEKFSENENMALFLAYLLKSYKEGFLSAKITKIFINPTFSFDKNIQQKIYLGSFQFYKEREKKFKNFPIYVENETFYFKKNIFLEKNIYELLKKVSKKSNYSIELQDVEIDTYQKKALKNAVNNNFSIICGGPGTGKSFLIKVMANLFIKTFENIKIAITAPTGKAALLLKAKFSENTKIKFATLHALLGISESKTSKKDNKILDFDILIVDEASMIDINLMYLLLKSLKTNAKLILVGDPNQLPPIDSGNIFDEFVNSKKFQITFLKKNYRFENSLIHDLSEFIKSSNFEKFIKNVKIFKTTEVENKIKENLNNFIKPSFEKQKILRILKNLYKICFLTSLKEGALGVNKLNNYIFDLLHKKLENNQNYYVPIIITKNNYSLNLFNGMLGIVEGNFLEKSKMFSAYDKVHFLKNGANILSFSLFQITHYDLAYSLTIHKSQGSEFDKVLVILDEKAKNLSKKALYTAVTRAKKDIEIISEGETLFEIIK